MEDLIQVIAFIAFAIIAGLVKKAASNKQKQQRPPARPQQPRPRGESNDGSLGDLLADIARQLGGEAPPAIPKAAPAKKQKAKKRLSVHTPPPKLTLAPPLVVLSAAALSPVTVRPSAAALMVRQGGQSAVRAGFIWSEILGTPKGLQEFEG